MNNQIFGDYNSIFASRFRELLIERKTTQNAVAIELGITRQSISDYINGKTIPTADKLKKIADFFNVPTAFLLGETNATTTDKDVQFICDYTGLNETGVEKLRYIHNEARKANRTGYYSPMSALNAFLASDKTELCLEEIGNYRIELANRTAMFNELSARLLERFLLQSFGTSDSAEDISLDEFAEIMAKIEMDEKANVILHLFEGQELFRGLINQYTETEQKQYEEAKKAFRSKADEICKRAFDFANGDTHRKLSILDWRRIINGNDN